VSVIEAQKVLLATVAKADGKIRDAEVKTAIAMSRELPGLPRETPKTVLAQMRYLVRSDIDAAIAKLVDLPKARRERIIKLLWVMALCDGELHPEEEAVIYDLADRLGIDRATVAKGQPDL
jgi:uncharacterized tellurite resistance protein B-like protein